MQMLPPMGLNDQAVFFENPDEVDGNKGEANLQLTT